MGDRTLTGQGLPIEISSDQIAELLREARAEALLEARQIIKQKMVQAILEQAFSGESPSPARASDPPAPASHLEGDETSSRPNGSQDPPPAEAAPASLQEEIAAIRRKILENEQALEKIKQPPQDVPQAELPVEARPAEIEPGATAYYVYAIVGKDSLSGELPEASVDSAYPLYQIPYQGLSAVVSLVSLAEFGEEELEQNLKDAVWLENTVRAHQAVLEAILSQTALVPMRFCTLFLSEARVLEMVAAHAEEFAKTLANLADKQEWGVKVYYDEEFLSRRIEETSQKIQTFKADIAGKSSGAAYFSKKKLEALIAEEVERACNSATQSSHDRLAARAVELRVLPPQEKEVTGRKEVMGLNGAYLVAGEGMAAFHVQLEELGREYGPLGFEYELTGPWPPYNFVGAGPAEGEAE